MVFDPPGFTAPAESSFHTLPDSSRRTQPAMDSVMGPRFLTVTCSFTESGPGGLGNRLSMTAEDAAVSLIANGSTLDRQVTNNWAVLGATVIRIVPSSSMVSKSPINSSGTFPPGGPLVYLLVWKTLGGGDIAA